MTDDSSLIEFITSQRWYGSKTREVGSATVVDRATLRDDLELQLVEVRFETGHARDVPAADGRRRLRRAPRRRARARRCSS